jgi:hypothetical protein
MKHTTGYLRILGIVILLGILINLFQLTWPVCLPASFAAVGWFITLRSRKPINSAAHAVLGPITIGLLLVSGLLLLFNLASTSPDEIGYVERSLIYLDNGVPSWSKLSPLAFVVVIICLTALAYRMPRLKLIAEFVAVNKFSSKATIALSAATSFTFFSNIAVVQPKVPAIYLKIDAVYRKSKEGQRKAVDRFLAARAVQRALTSLEPSEDEYCRLLLGGIAQIPTMEPVSKQSLAGYLAQQLYPVLPAEESVIEAPPFSHRSALTMLDDQLAAERAANDFADEAAKAAKESLSFGNNELKSIAWSFVDKLIGQQAGAVDQLARPFIDEIIDKYFDKFTDPIVTKQAEAVRHLFEHPGSGSSAAKAAANRETQSAMVLMSAREAELARDAAHQSLEAAQAARMGANAGDTARADADLANAERASARALKDADLAKVASQSITTISRAVGEQPEETRVAISAIGAIEAAQGVQIATETAEAAKVAESAVEAVEAAKAARGAAEATEAAKVLLNAIPK